MIAPAARPSEVRGVILPTAVADLLLPNAAVAEVVGYQEPAPYTSAPDWMLGSVTWRGCAVPLICVAMAVGPPLEIVPGHRARLAVCYTPSGNWALPYIGILASGPPRLVRFDAQGLVPSEARPENPFVLHALVYAERPAWIPDMDAIEQAVLEVVGA